MSALSVRKILDASLDHALAACAAVDANGEGVRRHSLASIACSLCAIAHVAAQAAPSGELADAADLLRKAVEADPTLKAVRRDPVKGPRS